MRRVLYLAVLVLAALAAQRFIASAAASGQPELVTICHAPGTPAEKTLTLPKPAADAHLRHGDRLGSCETGVPCSAPPPPPVIDPGTEPLEDEPESISETVAVLEGASAKGFNAAGAPVTFRLSCPNLQISPDAVAVYDNGLPVPYETLSLTADSVTLTSGLASGRHELNLLAQDIYGYTIEASFTLWAGQFSIPVLVLDENGAAAAGVQVVAKLADDPTVTATLVTGADGRGVFANLPNRSYNIIAKASGNRTATRPASVFDGTVVMQLKGFKPASPIDNNDFSLGTAGWDIGTAPVAIINHIEGSPTGSGPAGAVASAAAPARTAEASAAAAANLQPEAGGASAAADADLDLILNTSGEGQQSISRTFQVEQGYKSVTVRYRFITSEVPGGYFGTQFNDFFNVSIRSAQGGGSVVDGNSMNGLGLAAFDAGGATGWFESELPVNQQGDTIQVDVAVANVADGLFDSQVVVDVVKKKKLTISQVQLNDIDNTALQYLSASAHTYFNGQTRVHGTITVQGPKDDTLQELTVEVLEGGRIATGTLATALSGTLLTQFGDDEEIKLSASQLLFEIPGAQLAAANQSANGQLTLRVKAKSSTGETAEKDFGPVTKLVRYTGANRYGGRDENRGGDDWAKPGVRVFIAGAGQTWGDFSNMNGGSFAPDHQTHQTGNSADGWFNGYNARDAAVAQTIIGHLNTHGARIRTVYVTFAANSAFANAIANVTLNDGRRANAVIRNVAGHTTHFHWEVTDN
jgi:Carboxypeptidase regulatory-like domain